MRIGMTTYRYCSCIVHSAAGLQFAGALLIFQAERNVILRNGPQEIEQILRVETNLEIRTRILARNALFRFTGFERR